MSEELIIRHCAPTLASLKTGNLFTCRASTQQALWDSIRHINRRLTVKGLRMLPLRYQNGVGLVYLFRPTKLKQDLQKETACRLLCDRGYPCHNPNQCILHLQRRLAAQQDFPHEIGLFLGYPPEDVDGFIHRKHEAVCSGLWKVYGNADAAQCTFARYNKCTHAYLHQYKKGVQLEKLAVRT